MADPEDGVTLPVWRSVPDPLGVVAAIALVAASILFGHGLKTTLPTESLHLICLVAVLISAVAFGFWSGLIAAALAFLGYNFFFVEPLHTLSVARPEDMIALGVFLLAAGLTGFLAGRMREEAAAARHRAELLEAVSAFTADLAAAATQEMIEVTALRHLARAVNGEAALLRPDGALGGVHADNRLIVAETVPPGLQIESVDMQTADRAIRYGTAQPATARGWEGSRFSFHPLHHDAVLALVADPGGRFRTRACEQAITAILDQAERAIERLTLARAAAEARDRAEREAQRAALLASLSHDLRTPLATILGSVTSLRQLDATLAPDARADLLLAIEEEAGRLSRYVANLLHMTRLRSGLLPRLDWIDPTDVAHAAVRRARAAFPGRSIVTGSDGEIPLLRTDAMLLEQALFNLIDNAVKFSAADEPVRLLASVADGAVAITVTDQGPGIPPSHDPPSGAGLGLTICRGITAVLGGSLTIISPVQHGQGTMVRLAIPIATAA